MTDLQCSEHTKVCTACQEAKTLDMFYRQKDKPDGLQLKCKQCQKEYSAAWYLEHRSAVLLANAEWFDKHPGKARDYSHRSYIKNKDRVYANSLRWHRANPEKARESTRNWERAHPDASSARSHRRRARKLAAFVEDVSLSYLVQRDNNMCGLCRKQILDDQKPSIDHIVPLCRGGMHSKGNTQLAHLSCNLSKGAHMDAVDEYLWWDKC